MATKTDVKVYLLGMQEMKAYTCSRCHLNPSMKVTYFDDSGLRRAVYYCKAHYADFIAEENKPTGETGCEWCGRTDNQYFHIERFGESTGKQYKVCGPCRDVQDQDIALQFDEDLGEEGDDPLDLYRDLDNDDYQ